VKLRPWRWHPGEESVVAATRGRWLAVYKLPRAKKPVTLLRNPTPVGSPRVFLVHSWRSSWVHVYLPLRPNGSTGWVRADAVKLLRNPYRIVVRLRAHRIYVWRGKHLFLKARTVVGKPSTPTPVGTFFIVDLLQPPNPNGDYGPFAYDLSAHSDVFHTFAGGDGHVAIHGTNAPWLLGQSASHGCIRVSNAVIRKLERVLPLGTPVMIQR
jgi:lipoprotein-anchoring transpeptidase ErfK/SrfK